MANHEPRELHHDRRELQRLALHIERTFVAQTHLRTLLIAADKTVADDRRNLRDLRARIKRARDVSWRPRHTSHLSITSNAKPTRNRPAAPARTRNVSRR